MRYFVMNKRAKKADKVEMVPSGFFRARIVEEPVPPMEHGPADLRVELEHAMAVARERLCDSGEISPQVILYASHKKVYVAFQLEDDDYKSIAMAWLKDLAQEYEARALLFITEAWVRPRFSISEEDPRRQEALFGSITNDREHIEALQRFHRVGNREFLFEKPTIVNLREDFPAYDDLLAHLQF
jgi:hypothetical protein